VAGSVLDLDGAVSGAGKAQINGGTLYAASSFTQNVTFSGTSGELELAHSQAYAGTITGFSLTGTTSLDLRDIVYDAATTTATYSGTTASGTLTVTDGTHTATIKLIGDYTASAFNVASDGHGGTTVTDPPAPAQPHAFIAAMATLGAGAGGPTTATTAASPAESVRLARPA
jgi:hypothetical protein